MSRRRSQASGANAPAAEPLADGSAAPEADVVADGELDAAEAGEGNEPAPDATGGESEHAAPADEAAASPSLIAEERELDVIDVSEIGAPSREWVNRSNVDVRIELCSLNSDTVHNLTIAPGQRLRAPAIYADMVRTRAPQLILVDEG